MLVTEKSVSKRLEIVLRSRKEKINKLQLHYSINWSTRLVILLSSCILTLFAHAFIRESNIYYRFLSAIFGPHSPNSDYRIFIHISLAFLEQKISSEGHKRNARNVRWQLFLNQNRKSRTHQNFASWYFQS